MRTLPVANWKILDSPWIRTLLFSAGEGGVMIFGHDTAFDFSKRLPYPFEPYLQNGLLILYQIREARVVTFPSMLQSVDYLH